MRLAAPPVPQIVGQNREVRIVKEEAVLGITVSDGTNGLTFVRRIRPDSTCSKHSGIRVGDRIEKINGESMMSKRHFQVARLLRSIPIGDVITLGLVSAGPNFGLPQLPEVQVPSLKEVAEEHPQPESDNEAEIQAIFDELLASVTIQEPKEDVPKKKLIECINKIFEEYLGFDDDDLALSVWNVASDCNNLLEMSERIRDSPELSQFEFPEDLVFDMWGVVDDYKNKRLGNAEK